jgi:hypothetical protein
MARAIEGALALAHAGFGVLSVLARDECYTEAMAKAKALSPRTSRHR